MMLGIPWPIMESVSPESASWPYLGYEPFSEYSIKVDGPLHLALGLFCRREENTHWPGFLGSFQYHPYYLF